MSQTNVTLPPDYYLRNFVSLLDAVVTQYDDLLSPEETAFYQTFRQLTPDAQKLYVRLLTRKGEIFRATKLRYKEITDTKRAAQELESCGLIAIDPDVPLAEAIALWSKPEWLEMMERLGVSAKPFAKLARAELDAVLIGVLSSGDDEPWISGELLLTITGESIYQLQDPQVFDVLKLLFFGNLNQDLTDFVLRDLGTYRYENYRLDRETRLFRSRAQIEAHLTSYELLSELDDVLSEDRDALLEFAQRVSVVPADDPVLLRRLQKIKLAVARQLERLEHLDDALNLYQHLTLPDARERHIRVLAKIGREQEALQLCAQLLKENREHPFPLRFGAKLARRAGGDWPARPTYKPISQCVELPFTGESVEFAVVQHLSADGHCHYVENALFNSLFGLHYWDALFAPVPGAFSHPFQHAPHDLYLPEFATTRAELLAELADRLHEATVYQERWRDRFGCINPFVYWAALDEELIARALERIPSEHWIAVFRRFWRDLKNNCSGLPDLIHFPASGGYELIEVKGPGDRLQENQIAWMTYFAEQGIPHRVIQVTWCEQEALREHKARNNDSQLA